MKNLFTKYKIWFLTILLVFSLLLIISIVRFVFANNAVKATIDQQYQDTTDVNSTETGWDNSEIRKMKKEVYWLEQQLLLAKSDSITLGFNLADSVVQVQLKGTVLFQGKILKHYPAPFLESLNYKAYTDFARIAAITSEYSEFPKKPIKKVIAPKSENEVAAVKQDTVVEKRLLWKFNLNNNMNIVLTGVGLNKDSLLDLRFENDMLKYSSEQIKQEWIPKEYIPTLYLWLPDKDAKAIYRALPEKGKVIFRN
jgi:hypothetical protein